MKNDIMSMIALRKSGMSLAERQSKYRKMRKVDAGYGRDYGYWYDDRSIPWDEYDPRAAVYYREDLQVEQLDDVESSVDWERDVRARLESWSNSTQFKEGFVIFGSINVEPRFKEDITYQNGQFSSAFTAEFGVRWDFTTPEGKEGNLVVKVDGYMIIDESLEREAMFDVESVECESLDYIDTNRIYTMLEGDDLTRMDGTEVSDYLASLGCTNIRGPKSVNVYN